MLTQRCAFQMRFEITTTLKHRNDEADEIIQPFGNDREAQNETIGCIVLHPADDLVRHLVRGSDKAFARGCGFERRLAQRLVLFLRTTLDAVGRGTETVLADLAEFGKGLSSG